MIDLRSDTVTQPSGAMREAMLHAEVGDDVYRDDPSVAALEQRVASLLGKQKGLFVTSGTQANLLALLSHCQRGEEYIVGQRAHAYKYEAGGAAVLGSIQPQPLSLNVDGTFDLAQLVQAIKPRDIHFARTKLICLENTIGGVPLPLGYPEKIRDICDRHQLALHLDGARLVNAACYHGVALKDLAQPFDSISLCLSKGLGAPVGSVLVGDENFIEEARRWRKMLGGGWRQAGLLAAAGQLALDNIPRTYIDHQNAALLATGLASIEGVKVLGEQLYTNMVYVEVEGNQAELSEYLLTEGVRVSEGSPMRLVVHLDVSAAQIDKVIALFRTKIQQTAS
ncbi:low-specificity L-threonine aldolase [Umboniibacter marinipuniceus]|uniref:L-threonine aldolase n=1 Tax=Umboniibacter marinipuniceus TaxID=569599 RepID=A0A3M0A4F1_9GAMM|nr:low-specificity L-threonine aldolase [Umboniibacter marinipuniceus]RMA77658.1 L-threonine aldolase [Umboniibacter marinipuniceus]